jgi:hypothetical protein
VKAINVLTYRRALMQSNVIQQRVSIHGECPKIEGLLCFFHERGCDIYVDDEKIPQPKAKWARELRSK